MAVKNDYKNFVPPLSGRKFKITDNGDGTVSIEDVTEYAQVGDIWGAGDANTFSNAINKSDGNRCEIVNEPYTILASGWAENAVEMRKEYVLAHPSIREDNFPRIVLPNSLGGKVNLSVLPRPANGSMMLYTTDTAPDENITVQLIIEEVRWIE